MKWKYCEKFCELRNYVFDTLFHSPSRFPKEWSLVKKKKKEIFSCYSNRYEFSFLLFSEGGKLVYFFCYSSTPQKNNSLTDFFIHFQLES